MVIAVVCCLVLFNIVVQLTIETAIVTFTMENKTGLNKLDQHTLLKGNDNDKMVIDKPLLRKCKINVFKA